jgi:hypothetical protein
MDKNQSSSPSIADDVLHNPDHSRLTPEEIAKAVAHHKKNHPDGNQQNHSPKQGAQKKQGEKPK